MLKKMLAVLLSFVMISCCALALGEDVEYATYIQVDDESIGLEQLYSLEYPSHYIVVDIETINALRELPAEAFPELPIQDRGKNTSEAFGLDELCSLVESMRSAAYFNPDLQGHAAYLVDPVEGNYISIEFAAWSPLISLERMYLNTIRYSFQRVSNGIGIQDPSSFLRYGGQEFGHIAMTEPTLNGTGLADEQLYVIAIGDAIYVISFFYFDEVPAEIMEHVVSSFTVQAK